MKRLTMAWAFAAMAIVPSALSGAAFGQPIRGSTADAKHGAGSDAIRERVIAVDAGTLGASAALGSSLTLAFFDDTLLTLRVEQRQDRSGGFSLQGVVDGVPGSTFVLGVDHGQASASVWMGTQIYGLAPSGRVDAAGRCICTARQVRPEAVTRCAMGPGVLPVSRYDIVGMRAIGRENEAVHEPIALGMGSGSPPPTGACDCHDDQSTIDVLVVYTPAALTGVGGLPALTARLNDAVAAANQAYSNSGITAGGPVNRLAIRIAGIQPITYDEVAPFWNDHLDRVTAPADGYMDNVHALRDQYHADLVSLVVEDARFAGGAGFYAVFSDTSAFTLLNWRALGSGSLTFAHELGHNFGCAHDRANSTYSPFRWGWGYSFAANSTTYGTIMSYVGAVPLPNFSNPFIIHSSGQPMGTPLASPLATDNALTIATTRWTIASYRDAPDIIDCNGNGVSDSTDIANGTSLDANGNCRPDECEYRMYVDANNTGTVDGLSWNTAWTSLADALSFAGMKCSNVAEIWVADGTYKPDGGTGDRSLRFSMRSGLAVRGGFQGKSRPGGGETSAAQRIAGAFPSILSGDIGVSGVHTDNSTTVVLALNTDATAVLDGFTIERGYQDFDGAGVYASNSSLTVTGCTFRNNRGGSGPGFNAVGMFAQPHLTGCLFENNTATSAGAAVASRSGAHLTMENCTARFGTAMYNGAVTIDFNASGVLRGCTFSDNTSQTSAGAVGCFDSSTLTMENCTLERNHALASSGAGGAVAAQSNCTLVLTGCTIRDNDTGGQGGALYCLSSSATLTGCTIENNVAQSVGGGIVAYNAPNTLTVDGCTLRNNRGTWAGGIFCNGPTLAVRRTTLEGNQATAGSGGAMHLYNTPSTLTNVAMRANTATDDGGALSLSSGTNATVSNCTIYANSAVDDGGGILLVSAFLTLNNSILYANTAATDVVLMDRQLRVFSSTRTVNRSCVQGLTGQLGGTGNIAGDPLLADPATGNIALTAPSPCIDAGSNPLVPSGTTVDLAGNPRFVDTPATADTGVGPAPIVDLGAREFAPPALCAADIGRQGGIAGQDGLLDNNDFVVFINFFFGLDSRADLGRQGGIAGSDGLFDNNDFVVFINLFFTGC